MEVDASHKYPSFPAACKSHLFFLVRSSTYFPWGMELAVFLPLVFANAGENGINGGIVINRQWVDERGNPASWRVVICMNQPLASADGQRGEEQA